MRAIVQPTAQAIKKKKKLGMSLVVWWLRLHASNAGGKGLISGQGTKLVCREVSPKYKFFFKIN